LPALPAPGAAARAATPAERAGPRAIIEIAVAPSARLVDHVNTLGRKLPTRLGDLLLQSLAGSTADEALRVDAELLAALATDRPMTMVVANRPGDNDSAMFTVALPFASPDAAARTAASLGGRLSERGGAIERGRPAGKRMWTGVKDATLLLAPTYEDLWATGAQALAASRAPVAPEDATVTVDIEAILISTGKTPAELSAAIGDELAKASDQDDKSSARPEESPARSGPRPPRTASTRNREVMRALGRQLGDALSQSARARLTITASAADGLVLSVALEPKPGTALARYAQASLPYALDPALPIRDDRGGVMAWGSLGMLEPVLRAQLGSATPPGAGVTSARTLDAFLAAFTGGGSCVQGIGDGPVSTMCSFTLRPGADPRAALEAYAALVRQLAARTLAGQARRFSARIKKDILELQWPLDLEALSPQQADTMRSFVGGDAFKYAAAVRGGRLLQFQGLAPRARLLAWRDPAPGAPAAARPPIAEELLARTRGASFVLFLDPLTLTMDLLSRASDPASRQARIMLAALPGLASTRAPILFTAPAGARLAYELRIPMVTFDNVAGLVAPFMGLMGK
jgi:hypothetical protein